MGYVDDFLGPIAGLISTLTGAPKEQVLEALKGIVYLIILAVALIVGWKLARWILSRT